MSAFFVSTNAIDDAVTTLRPALMTGDDNGTAFGKDLLRMNLEAMLARYDLPADELAGYEAQIAEYTFTESKDVSEVQHLKSLNCLIYQCDEGEVFKTELHKRCVKHAEVLTEALSKGRQVVLFGTMMPFIAGYDDAEWCR